MPLRPRLSGGFSASGWAEPAFFGNREDLLRQMFGGGFAPSPTPGEESPWGASAAPEKPSGRPAQDNIKAGVQARHPAYAADPPKARGNSADEGGDGWEWADE